MVGCLVEWTTKEGKVGLEKVMKFHRDATKLKGGTCASCSRSSEAWPVPKLSYFLTPYSSWTISWAADSSLHTPFTTVVWHSVEEPQWPKCPLGLSPRRKGLPISTTVFTHRKRRRELFLDGQSKLACMNYTGAVW